MLASARARVIFQLVGANLWRVQRSSSCNVLLGAFCVYDQHSTGRRSSRSPIEGEDLWTGDHHLRHFCRFAESATLHTGYEWTCTYTYSRTHTHSQRQSHRGRAVNGNCLRLLGDYYHRSYIRIYTCARVRNKINVHLNGYDCTPVFAIYPAPNFVVSLRARWCECFRIRK